MIYVLCLLPIVLLGYFVYQKLRVNTSFIVAFGIFLSGFLSVLVTFFLKDLLSSFISYIRGVSLSRGIVPFLIYIFIGVAFLEEFSKWIMTFLVRESDKYQIILYVMFISLGFAFFENIIYIKYFDATASTILLRGITSSVLHAVCGVIMGFQLSQKKYFTALFYPVLDHGLYDLMISLLPRGNLYVLLFGVFFSLIIAYALHLVKEISENDIMKKEGI